MNRHRYGKSRYDLLESGVLTIFTKVEDGKKEEIEELAMKIADKIDEMSDQRFLEENWRYEQMFSCKIGTTEGLVECMLAEAFLNAFNWGQLESNARMNDIVIRIETKSLPIHGNEYIKMLWK